MDSFFGMIVSLSVLRRHPMLVANKQARFRHVVIEPKSTALKSGLPRSLPSRDLPGWNWQLRVFGSKIMGYDH